MEAIFAYPGSRKCTIAALCCSIALLSLVCLASKQFAKPAARPAKTYPARDEHPTEGVTVAIDPYDMADKAQIFSVNYRDEGFLPVFLIVKNDGDKQIYLISIKQKLVTASRDILFP